MSKVYVTDELIDAGKVYTRGEQIEIDDPAILDRLKDEGKVSTKPPIDEGAKTFQERAAEISADIADVTDEELLAAKALIEGELAQRGLLTPGPAPTPAGDGETNYSKLKVGELEDLAQDRGLDVLGTGKDGAVVKDDLVKALTADDA